MGLLDELLGGGQQGASPLQGLMAAALGGQGQGQGGSALGSLAATLLGGGGAAAGTGAGAAPGGALQGLMSAFEQQGLGPYRAVLVGDGDNHPVSPDQLHSVLGADQVQAMASQTGMQPGALLAELAQMLPGVIAQLSRGGQAPGAAPTTTA